MSVPRKITSIPKHQYESSAALGLTKMQTYLYVIIPQAVRRLIPLSINLITTAIRLIRSATQSPWSSRSMLLPFNKTSSPKSGITQPPFQQTAQNGNRQ